MGTGRQWAWSVGGKGSTESLPFLPQGVLSLDSLMQSLVSLATSLLITGGCGLVIDMGVVYVINEIESLVHPFNTLEQLKHVIFATTCKCYFLLS